MHRSESLGNRLARDAAVCVMGGAHELELVEVGASRLVRPPCSQGGS